MASLLEASIQPGLDGLPDGITIRPDDHGTPVRSWQHHGDVWVQLWLIVIAGHAALAHGVAYQQL